MSLVMPWAKPEADKNILSQIRDVSLGQVIRDEVLALILRGEFSPGDRITEPMIASRLGVSRVPVREALRDLESIGMVESRKHSGVYVRQLSWQETSELYELRSVLDTYAGRVAATASPSNLIFLLEIQLSKMASAVREKDTVRYYEANLHFHWEIIQASGNNQICEVYRGIVQKLHVARLRNLSSDIGMTSSLQEHQEITEAIRQGQADLCAGLMGNHVKSARERLTKNFKQGDDNASKKNS